MADTGAPDGPLDSAGSDSYQFSPDERNAMRSFLQRAEARFATMHRMMGLFVGGAGILTLLPILLRDVLVTAGSFILGVVKPTVPWEILDFHRLLLLPFLASVTLPLWALYLLFKDLVNFYF